MLSDTHQVSYCFFAVASDDEQQPVENDFGKLSKTMTKPNLCRILFQNGVFVFQFQEMQ